MEFISKYASDSNEDDSDEEMTEADQVRHLPDDEFIDDENSFQDQQSSNYPLVKGTRDTTEACNDLEDWKDNRLDNKPEYNQFNEFEKRIEKFNASLKQFRENDVESFYFAILHGTYFKLKGKDANFSADLQAFLRTVFFE